MKLDPQDQIRVGYLLGKELELKHLTPAEAAELRRLLAVEEPNMQHAGWDRLIEYGLILMGVRALSQALARL